jgi:predicted Co/Zn/Cd cation transporter (cation efflux family)
MKGFVVVGSVLLLGALNWAALHDIVKGEADVRAEWAVVLGSLAVAGVAVAWRLARHRT